MDQVGTTIIGYILVIGGLVSFLWLIIGTPLGIVFLILYFTTKEKEEKKKYKKWFLLSFSTGILAMIVMFILLFFIIKFFGISSPFLRSLPILTP